MNNVVDENFDEKLDKKITELERVQNDLKNKQEELKEKFNNISVQISLNKSKLEGFMEVKAMRGGE
ncbi:MAG: hypothetical protein ACOCRO_05715 [Halanaerobiales bacterium]